MLKEHQRFTDRLHVIMSGILIFFAFTGMYFILEFYRANLYPFNSYLGMIAIFALIVVISLYVREVSLTSRLVTNWTILREIIICFIFSLVGLTFFDYLFKFPHISRVYLPMMLQN